MYHWCNGNWLFSNMSFSSPGLLRLFIWLCLMAPRGADKCWRSQAPKLWSRSENETLWNTYVYFHFFLHFGNLNIIIPHYYIFRCLREHLVLMPKKPHVNLQGTFCACLCLRICWVRRKKETCWSHVIFFYHVYSLKLEVCYRSGLQWLRKANWSRTCGAGGGLLRH